MLCLAAVLIVLPGWSQGARPATATKTALADREAADLMRSWLGRAEAPLSSARPLAQVSPASIVDWRQYVNIQTEKRPEEREKKLRALYGKTHSPFLRGVILRAIAEDPAFRSRQALFIRRYGFYANWFNRFVYSGVQVFRGNVQAVLQLGVDAVHDLVTSNEAGPLDRRAYDMARRAETMKAQEGKGIDPEKLKKLERGVDKAMAEADLERANWAMSVGDPEAAVFYAQQAGVLLPGSKKVMALQHKAEAGVARILREGLASSQVGYPDRQPPVDSASAELLRRMLVGGEELKKAAAGEKEKLIVDAVRGLPKPGAGRSTMMRPWGELLETEGRRAPGYQRRWLTATMNTPGSNPDERLREARAGRRGQLWKYIFIGPERPREQVYKTASVLSATWNALQNIGLFYVFEVFARTGQSAIAPPVPVEELLDAQKAWLNGVPDPRSKEARKVGQSLAKTYLQTQRYDDARSVLKTVGAFEAKPERKINRAEASRLLELAKAMPEGPERKGVLDRVRTLAPNSAISKRADKFAQAHPKKKNPQAFTLDWTTLQRWIGAPLPSGIPGLAAWFDGNPANGEVMSQVGPVFERKDEKSPVVIRYPVMFPDGRRVHEVQVPLAALPEKIRLWFELASSQQREATETIRQLKRLPIPFEIQGGAGISGVDLEPKLLPLQTKPGEVELYR